ncbi:MAG: DinB family protein [Chloroflexi bacterium]|nr:DinB family protein [Chloroflexota bacterium]
MPVLVDFIRSSLRQLHSTYNDAIADLSEEQLHWRANDNGCPIAFILWHYYRTQDNVIQFVIQHKPTVWLEEGWDKKFGLDRIAQGTGMSQEDAQALRINSKEDFLTYMDAVAKATDEYLAGLDDQALEQRTTVKPVGEMPVRNAIGTMCLTHGFTHLGEIQHLRGLMGLRGMQI